MRKPRARAARSAPKGNAPLMPHRTNAQLETLDKLQSVSAKSARPLGMTPGYPTSQHPVGRRSHERGMGKLPPGVAFARFAMALAAGKGNPLQSAELAKSLRPDFPATCRDHQDRVGYG